MKKSIKKKQSKRGFTLVELLAVIVILAIVVGISITVSLSVLNNAKKKALQTAADTAAAWFDKQYEIYRSGLASAGLITIDEQFIAGCFSDDETVEATYKNCTNYRHFITQELIEAAGLKSDDFQTSEVSGPANSSPTYRSNSWGKNWPSRVYIDPTTGKSCVTLSTTGDAKDFLAKVIVCGGTCQKKSSKKQTYCKPINLD